MSKLEYLNPGDWSLHVIDGESDCVPDGWVLVPDWANYAYDNDQGICFLPSEVGFNHPLLLWKRKMKEYLVGRDGKYELVEAYHLSDGIEVPDGADCLTKTNGYLTFWNGDFKSKTVGFGDSWCDAEKYSNNFLSKEEYFGESCVEVLWQRNPSLNDQYAEIEKVRQESSVNSILSERQSQYGCYEDVAKTTQDILKALRIGNYENMPAPHQEALHMIASKMARLVHGDANHLDGWVDIGGYSKLIANLIEGK